MSQNLNDQSYRRFFSSPHMVRALFEGILPASLRDLVDLDTLQALPTNFISTKNIDRRADCIWQVRRRDGDLLYLVIMLEHQSRSERLMSVRFMGYAALAYEYLELNGLSDSRKGLPILLPIVLYSGRAPWRAPLQVSDLLQPAPETLHPYLPQMRYLLLDERRLVEQGNLPDENLAALLFRLEHNRGLEPTVEMLQTVLCLTKDPELAELQTAFYHWVSSVLLPRSLPPELASDLSQAKNFSELTTMMTTHSKNWGDLLREEGERKGLQQGLQKGRQEGLQAGRQQGLQQGAAATLSTLITHKFGELPAWAATRLQHATDADLKRWTLKILDAQRIEDIFS